MSKVLEAIQEINGKIDEVNERLKAGEEIINQCKKQMRVLRSKVKALENLKREVIYVGSAADGDL